MRKTNLKKGIVAVSVAVGITGGLVAGLALGVPGFAGAQANTSTIVAEGHGPHEGHGPRGAKLDAVAAVLGITTAELKIEINSGKSIADVASAKGVAITRVTAALVVEFKAHLDEKVASGVHTQAEADAKLAEFTTRVTVMVNKVRPAGALGMGEGRGMGSHGMGKGHGPGEGMGKGHGPRGEAATAPSAKA